jgi:hypothetical protein
VKGTIIVDFYGGPFDGQREIELYQGEHYVNSPLVAIDHPEGIYLPVQAQGTDYAMKWVTSTREKL